mgnify:CR=1 FL=1
MNGNPIDLHAFFRAVRTYGWARVSFELLLIGILVYFVLSFLRGTRGARMLRGVAFLLISLYLVVRLVAAQYGLERIQFLYEKFLLFSSFAVIVAFQPELRRALMRLGETRIFRAPATQVSRDADALVAAAAFLSRNKIGGLIAIEREVGLGGISDSGVRINADLSAPLLNTIFWPNSPLHDLGVIVRNGRILFAGVQFPLTESDDLPPELGSRHRAAVGMSEETDAIVIVVSEETGDISVAERGQLHRKLTPEQLRQYLIEAMGRVPAEEETKAAA